jgi:hydroxymethylpyrimidine pyrophosphatase-like HAD family hydrolase
MDPATTASPPPSGEARGAGVVTILVTGRMLVDVRARLPARDLFDAIVAEGGAVVAMSTAASHRRRLHGDDGNGKDAVVRL